jgi:NADH:ubiquinone oxidoreductase subunit 4 (subunit M)
VATDGVDDDQFRRRLVVVVVVAQLSSSFFVKSMNAGVIRTIRETLPLWLVCVPVAGTLALALAARFGEPAARRTMLVNLIVSLGLSIWLLAAYEPLQAVTQPASGALFGPIERFQFRSSFAWVGERRLTKIVVSLPDGSQQQRVVPIAWGPDIHVGVGVDGLSVWLVGATVLVIVCGWLREQHSAGRIVNPSELVAPATADGVTIHPTVTAAIWLWLEASLVGTLVALDVVLLVVCWMSSLLALGCLLARGGDATRKIATQRFLRVQWVGCGLIWLGLAGLVLAFGWLRESPGRVPPLVFAVPELIAGIGRWTVAGDNLYLWTMVSPWLFVLLGVGFTVPLMLAPFHRGFVAALASAPPTVAVVLAGVMTKLGVYGWLRFVVPLFPNQIQSMSEMFILAVGLSGLYAALQALAAETWRTRVAFATMASSNLMLLGVVTMTIEGLTGGVLRWLGHALTAGLVLWLLPSSEAEKRRDENSTHAAERRAAAFRLGLWAWIGLPGLSLFAAEFVTLFALFEKNELSMVFSLTISLLLAWTWVRADREQMAWSAAPWSVREWFVIGGLLLLNIAMGVTPDVVVRRVQPSLMMLLPPPESTARLLVSPLSTSTSLTDPPQWTQPTEVSP